MSLLSRAANRIRRDFFRWHYSNTVKGILDTRPLARGRGGFVLLSMVHHRDVASYLVAVKSFTHFANPRRIVMVCDPSITEDDERIVRRHIPHIEFRLASEFADSHTPTGGAWERLSAICDYVKDAYVVQLDADTVTLRPIPEVVEAINRKHGFVLGEVPDQKLMTLRQTSKRGSHPHVQALSEQLIASVGLSDSALYVRGCAGFTGFPPCDDMRARMRDFSVRMATRIGARWKEWGTEQVTSNYLVANANETAVLPFPKYCTPDQETDETAFLHFIGSMRFVNAQYAATSKNAIRDLKLFPVAEQN